MAVVAEGDGIAVLQFLGLDSLLPLLLGFGIGQVLYARHGAEYAGYNE